MAAQGKRSDKSSLPVPQALESASLVSSIGTEQPGPTSIKPPLTEDGPEDRGVEFQWKYAEETHGYIREYIRLADQKAFFFSAASTTLLAFLYKVDLVHRWIKAPMQWGFLEFLSFLATIGLAVSALLFFVTVFPRLGGSRRGLVFFGAIAECESSRDYMDELYRRGIGDLLTAKLTHIYELARVCRSKYAILCWGLWVGFVGLAAAVFLLVFAAA